MMGKIKIFICHANEDKAKAIEIYKYLKAYGFDPWLDQLSLLAGQIWEIETEINLRKSDLVIILFSKHSVSKRGYVQREFKLALEILKEFPEREVFIVPVRIEDCIIPREFERFHYCDVFNSGQLGGLVDSINNLLKDKGLKKRARKFSFYLFLSRLLKYWYVPVLVISIIIMIVLIRPSNFTKEEKRDSRQVLKIGRIIEGKDYLGWLKSEFEKEHPQYIIEYVPGIDSRNESTPDRFSFLDKEEGVQVFLGGSVAFHNERQYRLGSIGPIIDSNKENINYYDANRKWIGYYQKFLGAAWNHQKLGEDLVIRSVSDLEKYSSRSMLVPNIITSAAIDFFFALGMEDNKFDTGKAVRKYKYFLSKCMTLESPGPEAIRVISKFQPTIAVEWPHDALSLKKAYGYDCISISILDEAMPGISCISVLAGNETNKGVMDFVSFAVSPRSQKQHFEMSYRFPANQPLLEKCLLKLEQQKLLKYYPKNIGDKKNSIRSIGKYLDSFPYRKVFNMDYYMTIQSLSPGCM